MSIKVGIIGAGRIGKIHLRNLLFEVPGFNVQALFDPFVDNDFRDQYDLPLITSDENEFWGANIEAVVICSPSNLHVAHINKALDRQLHIFCEKPVSKNLEDHETLLARIEKEKSIIQIGFNRR